MDDEDLEEELKELRAELEELSDKLEDAGKQRLGIQRRLMSLNEMLEDRKQH